MGGDGEFMFDRVHAIKTENGRSRGDDGDSQMAKRGVAQLAGVDMRAGAVG